ncbi:MAG: peptide chain release factor 1 [Acidobacteriota bacterium]|nr:peptide chain release factor 1 [Acidobacteriota bacterium]MDE3092786.1 peptide chain release factor 1 [Acidobacteriota bacterium]MDE3138394.1 peptide chain release factor 1 [Acidobacteriota bacterium]MDE3145862.1 peptide chain release factor 1 [Acidobacteriota bacterium]
MRSLDDTLSSLEEELRSVEAALAQPDVASDLARLRDLSRRFKELAEINAAWNQLKSARDDLATAREMFNETSGDDRELWRDEVVAAEERLPALEENLETLLLPRDPNEGRNVILEIRGAEGGEEANLFAGDLAEMYRRYASLRGWKLEVVEERESDHGGLDEATYLVKGDDAWTRLSHEAGVHRVQRVPVTEAKGRVHTSSATVSVLPEAEEVDVALDPNELKIDVYRSSGPGGQSVNTTDSAVRITHIPTGIVVSMQDEKSQIQNRAKALIVLRSRLLKAAQDAQANELGDLKRSQLGGGGRSEKIRTYNFKENRVTDHRISMTSYTLDAVLAGDLDPFIDALLADQRARQLAESDGR